MVNRNISVGLNLAGLSYWSSELKFVDVARQSQEWITERTEGTHSHQWDTHEHDNITWRDDGYPAFLPRKSMLVYHLSFSASPGFSLFVCFLFKNVMYKFQGLTHTSKVSCI